MKEKKDLKKIFSIIGIIAIGIYLFFYLITSGINLFSNLRLLGFSFSTISTLWSTFSNLVLYGFIGFYLIYEMIKKSNKYDKVINIILFVDFCILALSSFVSIINTISTLASIGSHLNGIRIFSYVINLFNHILRIGLFVLFGINTMGIILKKKVPSKILTFIIWGLLVVILINSIISVILSLIGPLNVRIVLTSLGSLINSFSLSVGEACLAYLFYDKLKNAK